jgi:hypothetical protein
MVDLTTEAREYAGPHRGREVSLIGAATKLGSCQVRSKTDHPCPHRAVTEIRGVPFCERCAREQEAYFAIGNLAMRPQGLASDPERLRRIVEAGRR